LDERNAALLAYRIKNDVLSLKCPRCEAVFLDFEGCFALTCSRLDCRAGFCAWCLKDCGRDAHSHVPLCPEGKGLFARREVFDRHHTLRRQKKVREMILGESPEVQVNFECFYVRCRIYIDPAFDIGRFKRHMNCKHGNN
jgi:hypothetical protein